MYLHRYRQIPLSFTSIDNFYFQFPVLKKDNTKICPEIALKYFSEKCGFI
jgi:hypothetical protein